MASFLSLNVERLLIHIGKTYYNETPVLHIPSSLVSDELNINWPVLANYLMQPPSNFLEQDFTWFHEQIEKVFPVFVTIHQTLLDQNNLKHFFESCSWTGHRAELEDYWKFFIENSNGVENLETLLFITSIFERALGNVYLVRDKNVPFLLRDLLETETIKSIFGPVPVFFTQLLIGSPRSLNLRNLVWHGFLTNDQIFRCLISTLFMVISSFGHLLRAQNLHEAIPHRRQIINLQSHTKIIFDKVPLATFNNQIDNVKDFIVNEPYFDFNRNVWLRILQLYTDGSYGRCLLILLPQFEHLMRQIYCKINRCDYRLLTAETEHLYTTLDEIFTKDSTNKIYEIFSEGLLDLYHDVFSYQSGPRIRDKLSHGEIDLMEVNHDIVSIIIWLVLGFLSPITEHGMDLNLTKDIELITKSYTTNFHQNAILKGKLESFSLELSLWDQFINSQTIDDFCTTILRTLEIDNVTKTIQELKVHSIQLELNEIVLLLTRIIQVSIKCNKALILVVEEKSLLYNQRQLRSRQRKSYEKMIERIPSLYQFLLRIFYFLCYCTLKLFLNHFNSKCIGFLHTTLKCVENLLANIELNKNRWDFIDALLDDHKKNCNVQRELIYNETLLK